MKVKRLNPKAILPDYKHDGDAGLNLYSIVRAKLEPGARATVPTGIATEIPAGHVGLIWDRSGLSHKSGLKVMGGVIDAGYRGEIGVGLVNTSHEAYTIEAGDKIAQMLIQEVEHVLISEVAELSDTSRGSAGFGSTGR
jgi:dUTP pyrophosphatase